MFPHISVHTTDNSLFLSGFPFSLFQSFSSEVSFSLVVLWLTTCINNRFFSHYRCPLVTRSYFHFYLSTSRTKCTLYFTYFLFQFNFRSILADISLCFISRSDTLCSVLICNSRLNIFIKIR